MRARVLSIAPGLPFLATLAKALLDGRLLPGLTFRDDPLALAGVTLYVPTRRAARALGAEFARALEGRSAILPMIRPLGESDDASLFEAASMGQGDLVPLIEPLERRMLIARFVRQWKELVLAGSLDLPPGEEIALPASSADALWLAQDLCSLLDEAETEGIAFTGLAGLAPDRLAHWWQLTLTFLQILTEHWPDLLRERGVADHGQARNAWLRREADRLRREGSEGPVVIAGSTATAPAALELMRVVAALGNGALVLPGLDRHLDEAAFERISVAAEPGRSGSAPGHPQYGLKKILGKLLLPRESVDHIAPSDADPLSHREAFMSDALRPADTTDAWADAAARHPGSALDGLALVDAADEREEALAIAVAMRDALSDPRATVALTTPDRSLARRVVAELQRFGIAANDSAGRLLGATAPGTLLELAVDVALRPGDPVALLGLLKHPLLRLGFSAGDARSAARAIELVALRGQVGVADAASLAALFAKSRAALEAKGARVARPVRLVSADDLDEAFELAERLEAALAPLTRLRSGEPAEIAGFARFVTETLETLAADGDGDASALYAEDAGAALAGFLAGLVRCASTGFQFEPAELPDVLTALLATKTVRPRGGLSARAFVWGALEARLQHVDIMVLGGLNEGVWPQRATSDAFLSRVMRAEIALDPPERRIGLAAHDVTMALGSRRVVMTRSIRAGGAPAIASRWLQRMLTLAGGDGAARLRAEGAVFLEHARGLDRTDGVSQAGEPPPTGPQPRPPLADRPTRYSVTDIETLIRDPYAIHARKILKLDPLPDSIRAPGASDRGSLYHAILARFVEAAIDPEDIDAPSQLLAIAREAFDAEALPPDIEAIWWPRLKTLVSNVIDWERERASRVLARFAEARGEVAFPDLETTLSGFADRIDRMADGSIEIIDFKTGTTPSVRQARTLLAPQLSLEGAMAKLGGFPEAGPVASVSDLLYVRLRESDFYEDRLSNIDRKTSAETTGDSLSEAALVKVRGLFAEYRKPDQPFASRTRPFLGGDYSGDYDHLARAREWSVGDEPGMDEAAE